MCCFLWQTLPPKFLLNRQLHGRFLCVCVFSKPLILGWEAGVQAERNFQCWELCPLRICQKWRKSIAEIKASEENRIAASTALGSSSPVSWGEVSKARGLSLNLVTPTSVIPWRLWKKTPEFLQPGAVLARCFVVTISSSFGQVGNAPCSEPMGLLTSVHHLGPGRQVFPAGGQLWTVQRGRPPLPFPGKVGAWLEWCFRGPATSYSSVSPETGQRAGRCARNSCCFDKGRTCLTFWITRVSQGSSIPGLCPWAGGHGDHAHAYRGTQHVKYVCVTICVCVLFTLAVLKYV